MRVVEGCVYLGIHSIQLDQEEQERLANIPDPSLPPGYVQLDPRVCAVCEAMCNEGLFRLM